MIKSPASLHHFQLKRTLNVRIQMHALPSYMEDLYRVDYIM